MAAGNAVAVGGFEVTPEGAGFAAAGEGVGVEGKGGAYGFGGIVEEFDAEVADFALEEAREVFGGGLGDGVVERVAAADIGLERVFHAHAVAELDQVGVAGASAVGFVSAWGEEGAEDAVLHMEHRHVLMDDDFELGGGVRQGGGEVVELVETEVVGGGDAFCAFFQKKVGG